MGTGSFDSRTKEFADFASRKGLAVYETSDRFKFRSAKKLEEHRDEWLEFYKDNVEHDLNKILRNDRSRYISGLSIQAYG